MKKKTLLTLAIVSNSCILACVAASLAWFVPKQLGPDKFDDISGTSASAYFAYGDGLSAETAFGIATPRQLYNLAWLQYNGTFNNDKNGDGVIDQQYYFKLDESLQANGLDMTGWTLPPIGTEDYPFLGNFDGNGVTIKNLSVSNKADLEKPTKIDYNVQPEIVGFFGVVGKIGNTPSYLYTSAINELKNVTLENISVESKTSQTLIGLAGGYVNGTMTGVRIDGNATVDVNGQTSTAKTSIDGVTKLSDYGLVGYTTKVGTNGSYSQQLSEYYDNDTGGGGSGDDSDWGGSINPREYSRLIYDKYKYINANGMEATNMVQNTDTTFNSTPSGNYTVKFRSTTYVTKPYNSSSYSYYMDPDYFNEPADNKSVRTKNYSVLYHIRDGAYIPLKFSDETKVDTHLKNTGFMIGSSSGNAGSPKVSAGYISNLGNSINDTAIATTGNASNNYTTMTYNDANVEILTYSTTDGAWYTIRDSHNTSHTPRNTTITNLGLSDKTTSQLGFEKYDDSRNTLKNVLENAPRLNGVKFDNTVVSSSNLLNVTSGSIKLNGVSHTATSSNPYQFPKGSIDFHLKKTGFINFFAGTYYYSQTMNNFSFFTLNHITRNGNAISSIEKISEIYQNKYWNPNALSSSTTNPKFFYKYSDGSFSKIVVNNTTRAATLADRDTTKGNDGLLFNAAYALESPIGTSNKSIFKKAVNNLLFYFEVPVNDGEYAMGMAQNPDPTNITSFTGAYMVYLDIGANGDTINTDKVTAHSITTISNANSYPLGVDFAPVTITGNGGESIGVSIASGNKGVLALNITSANIAVTDSSSISNYSFQGSKYSASDPPSGNFIVSGNSPGPMPVISSGGTRVLTINLTTVDDDEYVIKITDELSDGAGTISSSKYEIDSGSGYVVSNLSAIEALSEEIHLADFRALTTVATLTRASGKGEFVTTYDGENCDYGNKIIDVDIVLNGSTINIGVTTGYTFRIGGTTYANGSTYPAS